MSIVIEGHVPAVPTPRQVFARLGCADLDTDVPVDALDAPWPEGASSLWRRGVSTRFTGVSRDGDRFAVRIQALASHEDVRFAASSIAALGFVGPVDADTLGSFDDVEALLREGFAAPLPDSGAEVVAAMIDEGRGPIQIPGPVRPVYVGPRVLAELRRSGGLADAMIAFVRRVRWGVPDDYDQAGVFLTGSGDAEERVAIWLPGRRFVMPRVDRILIRVEDREGSPMLSVPASAGAELAGEAWTPLDEVQALVEPLEGAGWEELVRRARRL